SRQRANTATEVVVHWCRTKESAPTRRVPDAPRPARAGEYARASLVQSGAQGTGVAMLRASLGILLIVSSVTRAQTTVTAREAFLVQPDAGVVGAYAFVAFPGEAKALTFRTGGPPFSVVLGGASAGTATPLTAESSSALNDTPAVLIKASDGSDW